MDMRIVFMGTPEFSLPALNMLLQKHEVAGVVTQSDKPKGRGMKLTPPPVKRFALEHNIPVYQPPSLKKDDIVAALQSLSPDVIVVAAYGKILPKTILEIPPSGCINIHASILPKYRGAAPIPWAILNGETKTGITTIFMNEKMDAGDILLKEEIPIEPDETGGTLHDKLSVLGARALEKTLELLEQNKLTPVKQNDEDATFAPMLKNEDAVIHWNEEAEKIHRRIRAFCPFPGAAAFYHGKRIKIFTARTLETDDMKNAAPGQVLDIRGQDGIIVATQKNSIGILELQEEGKKKLFHTEYVRGHAIKPGECFSQKEAT